jgi:glycine/D-amino acid oxidase-like deaminating enzyme
LLSCSRWSRHARAILNEDAAEVDPLRLTLALLRSADRKGLRAYSGTKLVTYRRHRNHCLVRTKDDFQVRARHVVFATGYESQQLLRQTEVRKFPEGRERPVIWESARPYLCVRTTTDSRIIAGGEDVDFVDEEKISAQTASLLSILLRPSFMTQ